jgi:hypothetical protein
MFYLTILLRIKNREYGPFLLSQISDVLVCIATYGRYSPSPVHFPRFNLQSPPNKYHDQDPTPFVPKCKTTYLTNCLDCRTPLLRNFLQLSAIKRLEPLCNQTRRKSTTKVQRGTNVFKGFVTSATHFNLAFDQLLKALIVGHSQTVNKWRLRI